MWTSNGRLGVVFNGEIYNAVELRVELEKLGHVFVSDHSDTEVLLHGYRQWSYELTDRLNGMWAFALYDRDEEIIFCSRDRFGKKPFFYASPNGGFVFASELTALLKHPSVKATVSDRSVRKYFAYGFIPAPLSLYQEISKLPAGCSLTFSLRNRALEVFRYWEFRLEPQPIASAYGEALLAEELRDLLQRAVRRRLVSDVPTGVFLSGGVDSSAVAACAVREVGAGLLNTFSVGFEEASFDESKYAESVSKHLGTNHHRQVLSIDGAKRLLPEICQQLDEPMADSSLLPTYMLCGYARQHVTVALGGDGADELFGGYAPFRALRWARLYQRFVPRPLHKAISLLAGKLPTGRGYLSLDFKIKRTLRGLNHPERLWNPTWMCPLDESELAEMFDQPVDLEDLFSEAIDLWDANPGASLVDQTLQFFTRLYLEGDILTKVDRASMMHSLEVRSPFLDIEVVDFARRLPAAFKVSNGETKCLLKKAMEPWLPREVVYRRKQGFAVPVAQWFRDGSLTMAPTTTARSLNAAFTLRKLTEHRQGMANHHGFLWSQLILDSAG
jgi:asparagine synthase (glutamine-hydrolysing)